MKTVTSIKNPVIQAAKSLQTLKGRREAHAFLVDGEHMVSEALKECPERVLTVFVEEGRETQYVSRLSIPLETTDVYLVPAHLLESISQVKTSQGIAAVCALPKENKLSELGKRLILLENVQDPGNVGTILRTIDAAGFSGCILTPGCADPFSGKTLRASMGSSFRVPVCTAESAAFAADVLREKGYAVIGAELHGKDFYTREPVPEKLCVMIGNEGAGLTAEALDACTHRFRLPMRGRAESLNAAVSAAIFMYDLMNR